MRSPAVLFPHLVLVLIAVRARRVKLKEREELSQDQQESSASWTDSLAANAAWGAYHDEAHSGHWAALQHAEITTAVRSSGASLPDVLTVVVNGRELPWDGDARPGKVNTNKIEVQVKRADAIANLKVLLTNEGLTLMERSFTDFTSEVAECFNLPPKSPLSLKIEWEEKADDWLRNFVHPNAFEPLQELDGSENVEAASRTKSRTWKVVTADPFSGDVQGNALFLPEGYDYETQWKRTLINETRLVARTFSIFDVASAERASTFDIRKHGFELEQPDAPLKADVQNFMSELLDTGDSPLSKTNILVLGDTTQQEHRKWRACMLSTEKDVASFKSLLSNESTQATCHSTMDNSEWGNLMHIEKLYKLDRYFLYDERFFSDIPFATEKQCRSKSRGIVPEEGSVPDFPVNTLVCVRAKYRELIPVNAHPAFYIAEGLAMAIMSPGEELLTWRKLLVSMPGTLDDKRGIFVEPGIRMKLDDPERKVYSLVKRATELARPIIQAQERAAVTWWKKKTGKDVNAACYSFRMRHTAGGEAVAALPIAHIDATRVEEFAGVLSSDRMNQSLGMPGHLAVQNMVLSFNKWINAGDGPIETLPLTVLDTSTLKEDDIDVMWIQQDLDSKGLRWSDDFRWYYTKLQRGEGYVFGTIPHQEHEGVRMGTPHSAFNIEREGVSPKPRTSMEMRCILVDKTVADSMQAASNESIEGNWDGGSIQENRVVWPTGEVTELLSYTRDSLKMMHKGDLFEAQLEKDGTLRWNDGDVWIRKAPKKQVSSKFRIGTRVRCKNDSDPWKNGVVVTEDPLEVKPDGSETGRNFEYVELEELSPEEAATRAGRKFVAHIAKVAGVDVAVIVGAAGQA